MIFFRKKQQREEIEGEEETMQFFDEIQLMI